MNRIEPRRTVSIPILMVGGMMLLGLFFGSWGIQKNLPYFAEADEGIFVGRAVRMASTGDLNPHWFGNPGSTTFYPQTFLFHIWYAATENGSLFSANPDLQMHFNQEMSDYFLLGRMLSVLYGVLSLPLTYLLGKRVFNQRIGLIGAWLLLANAVYWYYAQIVRTDTSALFWSVLSLWLCIIAYERPIWRNFLLAGLIIGFSIASRYFMVALIPMFFLLWLATVRTNRDDQTRNQFIINGITGFLAVLVGFAITTPYFFLDFATALKNLLAEGRSEHLGADGFTPWGNFWWYLTVAIPRSITWWQALLALAGMILAAASRRFTRIILVVYVLIFLIAISLSPLHWMRWVAQLMPLFALFTAFALDEVIRYLGQRMEWRARSRHFALALIVGIVSIWPLYQVVLHNIKQASPSTRVLARQWIIENLPEHSKIGQENYTAPLAGTEFDIDFVDPLSSGGSLTDYAAGGYDYLVASGGIYERYFAEPERYAEHVSFYESLFSEAQLLQRIEPSTTRAGPAILIFQLPE